MENLTCTKCGSRLPDYKWKANHWCRDCRREYDREYRKLNRDRINEIKREYNASQNGGEIMRSSKRKWNESERGRKIRRDWRKDNYYRLRDQIRAHNTLGIELRSGRIPRINTKLCVDCGQQAEHYHHDKGYAKEHRLDVVPLCSKCHRKRHGRIVS